MLTSTCAILPCRDLDKTVAFYEALGFGLSGRWDDFGGYLIFVKDKVEVHFSLTEDLIPETSHHAAYVRSDAVDAWAAEIAKIGMPSDGIPRYMPPQDTPWGMRELAFVDIDGNLFRVGQFLDG